MEVISSSGTLVHTVCLIFLLILIFINRICIVFIVLVVYSSLFEESGVLGFV
jgi:hypothetical protein